MTLTEFCILMAKTGLVVSGPDDVTDDMQRPAQVSAWRLSQGPGLALLDPAGDPLDAGTVAGLTTRQRAA